MDDCTNYARRFRAACESVFAAAVVRGDRDLAGHMAEGASRRSDEASAARLTCCCRECIAEERESP